MRIVHCLGWYLPDSIGGSELYVHRLVRGLQRLGHDALVFAPRDGHTVERYEYEGVAVVRYPVPVERSAAQHEGDLPHAAFAEFVRLLREARADVFHLHSLTYGAGLHHIRAARALGVRTVFTAHMPNVVCARGTMMRYGRAACDGRIDAQRCAACWLEARGVRRPICDFSAALLARAPAVLGRSAPARARTVLSAPARMLRALASLRELSATADRVVVVCRWLLDALRENGVQPAKLVLCRQGVSGVLGAEDAGPLPDARTESRLRVGYFGRAAREKGLDVIVGAVRRLPSAVAVALRVHAVPNTPDDHTYFAQVRKLAGGDPRIEFAPRVAPGEVQQAMRACDVVAIPSRWLETGPLVALEALAAGIPVLGSDLGGIAELVRPDLTGWLLPPDDVERWAEQLGQLARPGAARLPFDPGAIGLMREEDVVLQMGALYAELGPCTR